MCDHSRGGGARRSASASYPAEVGSAAADRRPGVRFDDELEQVRRRVDGWHDPIGALLAATPPEQVRHIDIHDLPDLPGFTSGRVALLGDAAHAMSPPPTLPARPDALPKT